MSSYLSFDGIAGILLAAGKGTRFDPSGERNKLRQEVSGGDIVAVAAAKNLLSVLSSVIAVVRLGDEHLKRDLQAVGCTVAECSTSDEGMAASLIHGLSQARDARAWIIALADMPYVRTETIRALAQALDDGAQIAAPVYHGQRGNPVAFGRGHLERLLKLRGDEGARRLLKTFPIVEIDTDDPGIIHDIDTQGDLARR